MKTGKQHLILAGLFLIYILTSCSSLSKTQIAVCNNYFDQLKDYNQSIGQLNKKIADVKFENKLLVAATSDSLLNSMLVLDSALYTYQDNLTMPFELRKAFIEINSYINGYSFKSSYNTDFLINLKQFMSYVPFDLGLIVFEIIYSGRKILIKPNVGKKIRKHIESGNSVIPQSCETVTRYAKAFKDDMLIQKSISHDAFRQFVEQLNKKPDSYDRFSIHNPVYLQTSGNIVYSLQATEHLLEATNALDSLHRKLYDVTRKRTKIRGQVDEMTRFKIENSYMQGLFRLMDKAGNSNE